MEDVYHVWQFFGQDKCHVFEFWDLRLEKELGLPAWIIQSVEHFSDPSDIHFWLKVISSYLYSSSVSVSRHYLKISVVNMQDHFWYFVEFVLLFPRAFYSQFIFNFPQLIVLNVNIKLVRQLALIIASYLSLK